MICFICNKKRKQDDMAGTGIYVLGESILEPNYCKEHKKKEVQDKILKLIKKE